MNKIIKKLINQNIFRLLSILAFVCIFMPLNSASAYYYPSGNDFSYMINTTPVVPSYISNNTPVNYNFAYNVVSVPRTYNDFAGNNSNGNTNNTPTVYSKTTASQTAASGSNSGNTSGNSSTTQSDTYSSLASNAIFGSNGILPSGIVQWLILGIFIVLIVILVRKVSGAEEKYQTSPLKHD